MTWIDPKPLAFSAICLALPLPLAAKPPLSASDWLSGTVEQPEHQSGWRPGDPVPRAASQKKKSDLAPTGSVEPVGVTRLGEGNPDSKGTVSPKAAGLPSDLWGVSDGRELARLVLAENPRLPATRRLLRRILAAQLAPPSLQAPEAEGELFLARVDKLLDMGATSAAQKLLHAAGPGAPERFRRLFDISLLAGNEGAACEAMDRTPGIAPSFPARIFCLAISGDWAAASLVQFGAEKLGRMEPATVRLLSHFLDDGYADTSEVLTPPAVISPLTFRLHEAIGQPLPTSSQPLAFALFDLSENSGWKAQLDAAERLARAGAIPSSQLRDIYLLQAPAASGGVWDRVAAVQKVNDALTLRDADKIAQTLPVAFDEMGKAGLDYALADMIGAESAHFALTGRAGQIALWLALAAGQAQAVAEIPTAASDLDRWLLGFARGSSEPPPASVQEDPMVMDYFNAMTLPEQQALPEGPAALINDNRRGEALLQAIQNIDAGTDGDTHRAAQGMAVLRALGQADIARQAAIELILRPHMNGSG